MTRARRAAKFTLWLDGFEIDFSRTLDQRIRDGIGCGASRSLTDGVESSRSATRTVTG